MHTVTLSKFLCFTNHYKYDYCPCTFSVAPHLINLYSYDFVLQKFPWHPEPVNKLTGNTASDINDYPSLIWFCDKNDGQLESLAPIAKEWLQKWNDAGEDREMAFFVSYKDDDDDEDGIRDSLKNFIGLKDDKKLIIVDVPSQEVRKCMCV